ncbi:MAG: SDR family NAD(P)-dependent oxidoreductase [Acidobacteria bacterium]|nr:SDR family NAD(P)-dependent oxidoreductase [Acidobacteriota bacterium]
MVTGGAKRVGREICLRFAAHGANVAFNYRSSGKEAQETLRELQSAGVRSMAIQADLSDADSCRKLVKCLLSDFGHVDILVNNASEFPRTPLAELAGDPERFEREFNYHAYLHMRAPLYLGMELGLRMKQKGWGRIVNITDRVTVKGQAYRDWVLYLVTKYGLYGITQVLAEELSPEVTVNSVAPGLILPPPYFTPQEVEQILKRIPLRQGASAAEIASDVVHLVLSDSKTGSVVLTDGGTGLHAL